LANGQFETQRGRLSSIAYRILGSASDAEDAVQNTYLRWRTAADVRSAEAYLVRVVAPPDRGGRLRAAAQEVDEHERRSW
jgi:Sigma-70 region 2